MTTFNLNIKSVKFDSHVLTSTPNPCITILERATDYTEYFACFYGLNSYNPNSLPFTSIPKQVNVCQFVGDFDMIESYLYIKIAQRFYLLPVSDIFANDVYNDSVSLKVFGKILFEFYAKIFDYNNEKS